MGYARTVLIWLMCSCLWVQSAAAAVNVPDFTLPAAVDGALVSSDVYRGRAMLITFFASWCPPCLQEIPALKAVHSRFHSQGFSVVALAVDEGDPGSVAQLVGKAGITYQVLMADQAIRKGFGGVVTIPTSFLVDKEGHVVKRYPGPVSFNLLARDIAAVL